MAFGQSRPGGRGRGGDKKGGDKEKGQRRTLFRRRKVCKFCADKVDMVDYKDVRRLRTLVTERGKIIPRLATEWKYVDEKTLEVTLREGVKYHDGETFTRRRVTFRVSESWLIEGVPADRAPQVEWNDAGPEPFEPLFAGGD